jgi:hypothetical protein
VAKRACSTDRLMPIYDGERSCQSQPSLRNKSELRMRTAGDEKVHPTFQAKPHFHPRSPLGVAKMLCEVQSRQVTVGPVSDDIFDMLPRSSPSCTPTERRSCIMQPCNTYAIIPRPRIATMLWIRGAGVRESNNVNRYPH